MIISENTKVKLGYLGTMEGDGMYENARNNPEPIIFMFGNNKPDDKRYFDMNREFFKVNDDICSYFIFKRENGIDIFVEMPLVEDTELFQWTRRDFRNVKTLWTQIEKGMLKFNCSYRFVTKDTQINIMWGRSWITNIWVKNGTNEDIMTAINEWIVEFEGNTKYSIGIADFKAS